jgi:oligosaccharide repeat unit polymerase
MHPAALFSLLWFIVLLLHFIFRFTLLDELPPLRISTYLIFFIGVVAFSLGSFIQTVFWQKENIHKSKISSNGKVSAEISQTFRFILLLAVMIGLPIFIEASYKVFIASNIENFFIGLRSELIYGDEDIGAVKYLFPFSFVVYAINLQSFLKQKTGNNKLLFIISFLATITYAIFTTGRIIFLAVLVVYMGMSFIYNRKFSLKKFFLPIILFMIIFISFGIVYGKGGNLDTSIKENISPAVQTTAIYMVASLNALDLDMHHPFNINYNGNNSFRFFIKIGKTLNLLPNPKVNELITPFIYVPYPTNVYTFYSPYIKDFGKIYSWLMIAVFGLLHTFLYYKAIATKSLRYSFYYSIVLFPLIISFFADQYLTLTSFWLQMAFFIEAIVFINNLFLSKE